MFDGFIEHYLPTGCGTLFARVGGSGPPTRALHGDPQPHLMWRAAAALPASRLTGAAADPPGYGASFRPAAAPDHAPYSKRARAVDLVPARSAAGFERFTVVPRDRGGRDGCRLALGHPGRLTTVAVLDLAPPGEVWARADASLTLGYRHWGLPRSTSATAITLHQCQSRRVLRLPRPSARAQRRPGRYPAEVLTVYRQLPDGPGTVPAIRGTAEPARASIATTMSRPRPALDRLPVLVLWSAHGALPRSYGDVPDAWRTLGASDHRSAHARHPLRRRGPARPDRTY